MFIEVIPSNEHDSSGRRVEEKKEEGYGPMALRQQLGEKTFLAIMCNGL